MIHEKLPHERRGLTHHVVIDGVKVTIRTGEYEDGRIGEIFFEAGKEGDEMRILDSIAISISVGLQRGVPLRAYTSKLKYQWAGTGGLTDDEEIPVAHSIIDYCARWLELRYLTPQERAAIATGGGS